MFEHRAVRCYLVVEWNGLGGTRFYVRCRNREHADALFTQLLESTDVAGVSMYANGRFIGANDGAGS